jgi:hypothetical protein
MIGKKGELELGIAPPKTFTLNHIEAAATVFVVFGPQKI